MSMLAKLLPGTGILIAIYLFVKNADGASNIIDSLGKVYSDGVKTLQGNA